MIRLEDVTNDRFDRASFEVASGSMCEIVTSSREDNDRLLYTILGMSRLNSGRVFVLGKDVLSLGGDGLMGLLRRVGVVWKDGGFISNLMTWENIMLPLRYHAGGRPDEVEDKVAGLFAELGKDPAELRGYMMSHGESLSAADKMLACFVRVMLLEPEVVLYDSVFEGLHAEAAERVSSVAERFHRAMPGRTSIHITSDERRLGCIKADMVLRQKDKGFVVWE